MQRKYIAFISYSHSDNREEGRRWANWLHEALESYEVPTKLVGRVGEQGQEIPRELFPIFRDEKEFAASHDLKDSILAALKNSEFLVVICSPRSAASLYVDAEVRAFKEKVGGSARIIALMVDGEPFASVRLGGVAERECLPPSLLRGVPREDGSVDWEMRAEPLCADARIDGKDDQGFTAAADFRVALRRSHPEIDGKRLRKLTDAYSARLEEARMKVIAGIFGVPLGTLTRQSNQFRIQRLRKMLLIVGTLALGAMLAAAWAFWAQHRADRERRAAEHANGQANQLINEMLGDLGEKLRPLGKLDLLAKVSESAKTYFTEMPEGQEHAEVTLQRAIMWMAHGDVLEAQNRAEHALDSYRSAQRTLEGLGAQGAAAPAIARRLYAVSFERIADVEEDRSVQDALLATKECADRLEQLQKEKTGLPKSLLDRDLAQAHERMGDILEDGAADLEKARMHFDISRKIRRKLSAEFGEKEPGFQRDYGVACARIGDLLKMEGRYEESREAYKEGLSVRQGLLKKHGLNAIWISEVSRSYDSLGLAEEALGKTQQALASHEQALKIRRDLALYNPTDKKGQADLARSYQAVARIQADAGRIKEAKQNLEESLTIQHELAFGKKPDIKVAIDWINSQRLLAEWRFKVQPENLTSPELVEAQKVLQQLRQDAKSSDNAKLDMTEARLNADFAERHLRKKAEDQSQEMLQLLESAEKKLAPQSNANVGNIELKAELAWIQGLRAIAMRNQAALKAAVTVLDGIGKDDKLSARARVLWLGTLRSHLETPR